MIVTKEQIDVALDALVEEYGADYVYTKAQMNDPDQGLQCVNVALDKNEQPQCSCIIGHLVVKLELTTPLEMWNSRNLIYSTAEELFQELGAHFDDDFEVNNYVVRYLTRIQELQDRGTPWGKAVARARS